MAAGAGMDRRASIGRAGGLLLTAAPGGGSRAAGARDPRLRTLRAAVRGQVLPPAPAATATPATPPRGA